MLKTTIVHHIYEMCIDIFFDNLKKNFPVTKKEFIIGDTYSIIHDKQTGEYFYNCTIIHPTELSYIEDILYDELELGDIWLAIKFTAYKDGDGDVERYDSDDPEDDADQIHFLAHEEINLEFIK